MSLNRVTSCCHLEERFRCLLLHPKGLAVLELLEILRFSLCCRELSHAVADISIHGNLSSVHCSLDLNKYKLIRGLLENNLGEPIEEFMRPYDLQDPRILVRASVCS